MFLVAIATLSLAACSSTATTEENQSVETTEVAPESVEVEPLHGASTDTTETATETATEAEAAH